MGNKFGVVNNNICTFGATNEVSFQIQRASVGRQWYGFKMTTKESIGMYNPLSLHELWKEYKFGINWRISGEYRKWIVLYAFAGSMN